jgi:hypothetical protein
MTGQAEEEPLKDETIVLRQDGWSHVRGERTRMVEVNAFRFDRTARRWDAAAGERFRFIKGDSAKTCFCFSCNETPRAILQMTPNATLVLTAACEMQRHREVFVLRPLAL